MRVETDAVLVVFLKASRCHLRSFIIDCLSFPVSCSSWHAYTALSCVVSEVFASLLFRN